MAMFWHQKILPKNWQILWKTVIFGNICQIWHHLATLATTVYAYAIWELTRERRSKEHQ